MNPGKTTLEQLWEKYGSDDLNYDTLPDPVKKDGIPVSYRTGNIIVEQGGFPEYIYFIKSGTAKVLRDYRDGKEFSASLLNRKSGVIGLLEAVAHQPAYTATVRCITDMELVKFRSACFYHLIMTDISLLRKCLRFLTNEYYQCASGNGSLYYLSGEERVRSYLISYCQSHLPRDGWYTVQADYTEIASQLGISTRTVGRAVRKLKEKQEAVTREKKIMLSEEQLRKLLAESEAI